MSQKNVELAQRSVDAINRRDLDAFLTVMAADATVLPQFADGDKGNDGVARWWKAAVAGIPDVSIEIVGLWDLDDNLTVAELKAHGQGASGMPFEQTYWTPARWRDGECIWWGVFLSEQDALQAARLSESGGR